MYCNNYITVLIAEMPIYTMWLFGLFSFMCVFQVLTYLLLFRKSTCNKTTVPGMAVPVSVVIAARNESENLRLLIPALLNQKYPDFEIVVIDDRSEDDSYEIIREYMHKSDKIICVRIDAESSELRGKKNALTAGIIRAKNNLLLFIDADCLPVTDMWISCMVSGLKPECEIVLGYSGFYSDKSFLNEVIRYDTVFIGMQYSSFACAGLPYMGVGRNLLYTKSLWQMNNGFTSHADLISGDDDLFVQQVANRVNTAVRIQADATTRSKAAQSFIGWCRQKSRHFSTAGRYPITVGLFLVSEPVTRILYWLSFLTLLFTLPDILKILLISMWIFREMVTIKITCSFCKITGEPCSWVKIPFYNLILPFIYIFLWAFNKSQKGNYHWK